MKNRYFEILQYYFIDRLGINIEKSDIVEEDIEGYGYYGIKDHKVHINKTLTNVEYLTTLAHEFMHLIQYEFKKSQLFNITDEILYELVDYSMRLVEYEARYVELDVLCFINSQYIEYASDIFDGMDKNNTNYDLFKSKIKNINIKQAI